MHIYNSQTRRKEKFEPLRPGKVGIYACGPTVYNYFHIGNARPFITFDVLRRQLEREGYDVTFIQNFTDIDDKMIRRAQEEGITVQELGELFIQAYYEDAMALGVRPATVHPRATEHMGKIIEMIQSLIDKGYAYANGGDVYYKVSAFADYGKLSGQTVEEREMGASQRLDVDTEKQAPEDFVLWKAQKSGEPAWESPWGMGRPGWHIECSAMSTTYLGDTLDIHCGGKDLLFPHHENEIAQSEAATGHPYVRYWMHNGFINVDNEKMSKSKGNFFTIRDIAKSFDLEAVRMFMLSAHYRSPINFSREQIEAAAASLERLYIARDQLRFLTEKGAERPMNQTEVDFSARLKQYETRFDEAMDDDLNTAGALGCLFELVKDANTTLSAASSKAAAEGALQTLTVLTDVLGLLQKRADALPDDVVSLMARRAQARRDKDWALSDQLRDEINALGYVLEDTPQGQKVRKG